MSSRTSSTPMERPLGASGARVGMVAAQKALAGGAMAAGAFRLPRFAKERLRKQAGRASFCRSRARRTTDRHAQGARRAPNAKDVRSPGRGPQIPGLPNRVKRLSERDSQDANAAGGQLVPRRAASVQILTNFSTLSDEHRRAADHDLDRIGHVHARRAGHRRGRGGDLLSALADLFDHFHGAVEAFVLDADQQRGIAGAQEAAGGGQFGHAVASRPSARAPGGRNLHPVRWR